MELTFRCTNSKSYGPKEEEREDGGFDRRKGTVTNAAAAAALGWRANETRRESLEA